MMSTRLFLSCFGLSLALNVLAEALYFVRADAWLNWFIDSAVGSFLYPGNQIAVFAVKVILGGDLVGLGIIGLLLGDATNVIVFGALFCAVRLLINRFQKLRPA